MHDQPYIRNKIQYMNVGIFSMVLVGNTLSQNGSENPIQRPFRSPCTEGMIIQGIT